MVGLDNVPHFVLLDVELYAFDSTLRDVVGNNFCHERFCLVIVRNNFFGVTDRTEARS